MNLSSSRDGGFPVASIVVPTFNRAALLPRVLAALLDQDFGSDYEILVVDDGSADATPQVLKEWAHRNPGRLRAFRQANAGPARARNHGAEEARGPLLVFIDDDCVAERSWLRELKQSIDAAGAAAVAGTVVNSDEGWVGRYINRESVIDHVVSADGSVLELITGNVAVKTEVFRRLGGFDEAIRVAGGEDTEFSVRLRDSGLRIARAPQARVYHDSQVGLRQYLQMIHRHGRGRRRLGERFSKYRLSLPRLRLVWLAWPVRSWLLRDYRRYRRAGVSRREVARYLLLRYLENLSRVAGYIRGT